MKSRSLEPGELPEKTPDPDEYVKKPNYWDKYVEV